MLNLKIKLTCGLRRSPCNTRWTDQLVLNTCVVEGSPQSFEGSPYPRLQRKKGSPPPPHLADPHFCHQNRSYAQKNHRIWLNWGRPNGGAPFFCNFWYLSISLVSLFAHLHPSNIRQCYIIFFQLRIVH